MDQRDPKRDPESAIRSLGPKAIPFTEALGWRRDGDSDVEGNEHNNEWSPHCSCPERSRKWGGVVREQEKAEY